MVEITAALTGARAAFELIKAAVAARDDAKLQAALADMGARLTDAILSALASAEKAAALQAALSAAEREKAEAHAKLLDRAQYTLHEIRPGAFVYRSQPVDGGSHPPQHYLCQPCYDGGVKAVLRHVDGGDGFAHKLECPHSASHTVWDTPAIG